MREGRLERGGGRGPALEGRGRGEEAGSPLLCGNVLYGSVKGACVSVYLQVDGRDGGEGH